MASANSAGVILWTDDAHAPLAGRLLDALGDAVAVVGIGGPRVAEVDALATKLGVPQEDDLRKLIVERPAAFLLITTMQDAGAEDLLTAAGQGFTILTLEPPAGDLSELNELMPSHPKAGEAIRSAAARLHVLPAFLKSPGFLRAAEPLDLLGPGRLVAFESYGPPAEGSLYARLYDAWHTVLAFTTLPESIDASLTGDGSNIPDDLRRLTGRLGAHGRMSDGSVTVIHLSSTSSTSRRELHILAEQAELRTSDTGYDLRQANGTVVEHADESPVDFADLIVAQWRPLLQGPASIASSVTAQRHAEALACCSATLLSARTGQPESPRRMMEMGR